MRLVVALAVMVVLGALAAPADARRKPSAQRVSVALDGGAVRTVEVCGQSVPAAVVDERAPLKAAVRLADRRGLRSGGRHARLIVERCAGGRWERVSDERFGTRGRYRRVRTYRLDLPTAEPADLRVQAIVRGDRRRRAARSAVRHLRVGVGEIVDQPVSFEIENRNRSRVPCDTDNARYTIAGTLVAPRSALTGGPRSITAYLHGVEISDAYFHFKGVPGYDFLTEMAKQGHASVSVDRVGHGESGLPPGALSCVGGQADIANQIVGHLRKGEYRTAGGTPSFGKVALAGHSFGTLVTEVEAISFHGADAYVLTAFAAEGIDASLLGDRAARGETGTCPGGGNEKRPGGPTGYATLWPDDAQWTADTFFNTDPAILAVAAKMRERSPCGELNSAVQAGAVDGASYREVTQPVLMVFGRQDAIFPPPAGENHKTLFTGAKDLELVEIEGAGHTLMLQRTAPQFRTAVSRWLKARGF